jgi:oligosaccharide repeat unit polymerase
MFISFFIFKKDVLSPSFITSFMYSSTVFIAILGFNTWNVYKDLSSTTIIIISLGVFYFFVGEVVYRYFYYKFQKNSNNNINKKLKNTSHTYKFPNISKKIEILIIVFVILTLFLTYKEVYKICIYYGHKPTSIGDMLNFYRTKTLLYSTDATNNGITISGYVAQMQKMCYFLCVFNMYFFLDNFINKKEIKSNFIYLITIILTLLLTFLTSSRSLSMHMFVAFVALYILLYRNKCANNKINKKKNFRNIVIFTSIIIVTFYLVIPLVGRKTNMKFYDYVTFYLGSSVPSLNVSIDSNLLSSDYFGENTFYGFYYTLAKLGITSSYPETNRVGVVFGDYGGSNVYTSFNSYYLDFGIMGVILLSFIFGFIISMAYKFVKNHPENIFAKIIYVYYMYVLIDQIRGDSFYSLISISTISYLIIAYLLYLLYKNDFKRLKNE